MNNLPKEYRAVTSPSYNLKVFDYWGDCYESVFIMLKPFFRFKPASFYNLDKIIQERSNWDIIIQNECEPVKWQEIIEAGVLSDFREIAEGLTYYSEFQKNKIKLEMYCEAHQLLYPYEDTFSPFQVDIIQNCFRYLDYKEFFLGPEFPAIEEYPASDEEIRLDINAKSANLLHSKNIYPLDRKILFSSAFDMHYSFICSERKILEALQQEFKMEGFFCDANTTTWWAKKNAEIF